MDFQQFNQQQPGQQPINQPIQPTPPVFTQPSKNNWKIIILVVAGILVLGGISYGAYYYWQNNKPAVAPIDEIANWQTYKNNTYGFEVKCPKDSKINFEKWPNENENTITITNIGNSEFRLTTFPIDSSSIQFKNVSDAWDSLNAGKNNLEIVIRSPAGNEVKKSIEITYDI